MTENQTQTERETFQNVSLLHILSGILGELDNKGYFELSEAIACAVDEMPGAGEVLYNRVVPVFTIPVDRN